MCSNSARIDGDFDAANQKEQYRTFGGHQDNLIKLIAESLQQIAIEADISTAADQEEQNRTFSRIFAGGGGRNGRER